MATLKITQIKSRIGSTAQQRKNLAALGLRKINHTVTHSDSAIILGMLNKVKHLVKVEVVEEKATKKAAKKAEAVEEAPKAKKPAAKKVTKTKKEE